MARAGDVECRERPSERVEHRERPVQQRRRDHATRGELHVVRPDGIFVRKSTRPSCACTCSVPESPLVTNARPLPNVTCCGARSAACVVPPTAKTPRLPERDPQAPVRRDSRRRAQGTPASGRARCRSGAVDSTATCSDAEPSPAHSARSVGRDRQVARPAGQPHAVDDNAATGVDEQQRCSVPSRSRTHEHRPGAPPCTAARRSHARHDARGCDRRSTVRLRRVTHERDVADPFDRARIRERGDRADDAECSAGRRPTGATRRRT